MLVNQIRTPMTYKVQHVGGPNKPGGILTESPRFKVLLTYDAPVVAQSSWWNIQATATYDENGMPLVPLSFADAYFWSHPNINAKFREMYNNRWRELIAVANLKAADSEQRLLADLESIWRSNTVALAVNAGIGAVLTATLDAPDMKNDEFAWNRWWYDGVGYRYDRPEPTTTVINASPQPPPPTLGSCFAAGTLVHTLDGHRPIESLQVGDRVLTQHPETGALSFETITVTHHNPPTATVKVAFDSGETIVASIYHRFYRAGVGWIMAREL